MDRQETWAFILKYGHDMYNDLKREWKLQGFLDQNLYNIIKELNIYLNVKIT